MAKPALNNWQAVQAEVRRRIHARIWAPGDLIPNEQALADEFGCARATVNRALQNLSDAGVLERRRKAGTRVALHPVRKATLDIPLIRREIEGLEQRYGYQLLLCERTTPPETIAAAMRTAVDEPLLYVKSVHLADDTPFVFENRWINLSTAPDAALVDFATISANEWLVSFAPFTHGDIAFCALSASAEVARHLKVDRGEAVFVIDRMTWDDTRSITSVRQCFQAGYQMQTRL